MYWLVPGVGVPGGNVGTADGVRVVVCGVDVGVGGAEGEMEGTEDGAAVSEGVVVELDLGEAGAEVGSAVDDKAGVGESAAEGDREDEVGVV